MDRHGLHAPPCYAKPESADTLTSIDFFHSSADAVNEKPLKSPVDHTLAHRHEMRAPSSAMSSHNPFMQSDVNRLEGTAMNMIKSWHPFQSFRGYFSDWASWTGFLLFLH
ncbi:hypothetical protein O6H91_02G016400 [Diphasiastrum complanatum]|uniref:Uncharacterized protein n=1 Tax=Diphasiastrum complanatum TaxID=34168 RepID=A0ACC2ED94_DIPCM|nr:hypothetical protein O6H91_02G016400 [Diphasiastrum complanatum]